MIKILLVDDDIAMLDGFEQIIEWGKYNCTIVGKFYCGEDALKSIKKNKPDILITDITMPDMDGLTLIKACKELEASIKTIILSCHDDFHYAKEAIEMGVDDYLVKDTLTEYEIIKVIKKTINKIEEERYKNETINNSVRKLEENRDVIIEKLFLDIIENTISSIKEVEDKAKILNICLPCNGYRVIGIFIDNYEYIKDEITVVERGSLKQTVLNSIKDAFSSFDKVSVFSYTQSSYIVFYCIDEKHIGNIKQKIIANLSHLNKYFNNNFNLPVSSCISSKYYDVLELSDAVEEVRSLRNSYFYKGSGLVITENNVFAQSDIKELYKEFRQDFINCVCFFDKDIILNKLDAFFELAIKEYYSPKEIMKIIRKLLFDTLIVINKKGLDIDIDLIDTDTFDMSKRVLIKIMDRIIDIVNKQNKSVLRKEILVAIQYIEDNIQDSITCETVAELVYMNRSYFSRLFKLEMGMSFSQYLTKRRVEKASELLTNTKRNIENISKAVGIINPNYFYKMFKRYSGKTPSNVRKEQSI